MKTQLEISTISSKINNKDLTAIRTGLRKAFTQSKYKAAFLAKHKVTIPRYTKSGKLHKKPWSKYKCVRCEELFKADDINLDHIEAVGSFKEAKHIEQFFFRIFCDESNWQILCHECHSDKTKEERADAVIKRKKLKTNMVEVSTEGVIDMTLCGLPVFEDTSILTDDELAIHGTIGSAECSRYISMDTGHQGDITTLVMYNIHKQITKGMIVKSVHCGDLTSLKDRIDKDNQVEYAIKTPLISEGEVTSLDDLI